VDIFLHILAFLKKLCEIFILEYIKYRCMFKKLQSRAGSVAQVVEHLPSKLKSQWGRGEGKPCTASPVMQKLKTKGW
jgi:hypothetical protein